MRSIFQRRLAGHDAAFRQAITLWARCRPPSRVRPVSRLGAIHAGDPGGPTGSGHRSAGCVFPTALTAATARSPPPAQLAVIYSLEIVLSDVPISNAAERAARRPSG